MENNSITGSNLNTKHSLLSAQADLNTGTVFHNDALPPRPASAPVVQPTAPKPLPQSVQDASDVFKKRMEIEKEKSISALQSTVGATVPKNISSSLEYAESTKPLNNPFVGMTNQRSSTQVQRPMTGSGGVVFDSNQVEAPVTNNSTKSHSIILFISILVIVGLLGGGIFYWYEYMGGKDLVQERLTSVKSVTEKKSEPVKSGPAFPAAIKTSTTTQVVSPKVITPNTFAPTKTTVAVPKKSTIFSDAEKEIVSTYISTNINKLSKVKSSTGFSVEDIRFDGPNRALVTYGDGDLSVSAVANFTYTNGVVKVNSFSVLEK